MNNTVLKYEYLSSVDTPSNTGSDEECRRIRWNDHLLALLGRQFFRGGGEEASDSTALRAARQPE